VSSRGGGSDISAEALLALNLLLFLNAKRVGITEGMAVRISLGSAGVWWAVFTIPTLLTLRNRGRRIRCRGKRAVGAVLGQLRHTLADIRRYPQSMMFLIAYLLYNDAIQAVLALASQFGNDELKIPVSSLTMAILMVQFVGSSGRSDFSGGGGHGRQSGPSS
jgi:UMF1 family MFS transporter